MKTARKEMMGAVAMVADTVTIPNADSIKGNITLPAEKNGVSIEWTSSNEDVISTKVVKNEGYDDTPAGVVTRQKKDTKVTLTAEIFQEGKRVHHEEIRSDGKSCSEGSKRRGLCRVSVCQI